MIQGGRVAVCSGGLHWSDSDGGDEKWLHSGFTLKAGTTRTRFADRSIWNGGEEGHQR